MKYVKIRSKDYTEALMELRRQHGDDAIPISHRYVREGGILKSRLFGKEVVELTAAIQERKGLKKLAEEHKKINVTVGEKNDMARELKRTSPADPSSGYERIRDMQQSIDAINTSLSRGEKDKRVKDAGEYDMDKERELLKNLMSRDEVEATQEASRASRDIGDLEREFAEIRRSLQKLMDQKTGTNPSREEGPMGEFQDLLLKNDFENDESIRLLSEVKKSLPGDELRNKYSIEKSLKDLLKSKIVTTGPIEVGKRRKVIMFVGPTGVGKTTTMAKLGALYALRESKKVSFVTIDNYRIAATEQLKKYAEIMGIPISALSDQKAFREHLLDDRSDIVLVDTSGRSHRNEVKLSEIRSFAESIDMEVEKVLCVSATTKRSDLDDVFHAFDVLDYDSVIITKVDETSAIGNVVNVADKYNKPISYITNGQEVPNDIAVATTDGIVELMMGTATTE